MADKKTIASFLKKLDRFAKFRSQADKLEAELSKSLSSELNGEWFLAVDPGDGIILVDEDSRQYRGQDYSVLLSLPAGEVNGIDELKNYLEKFKFN